MSAVSQWWNRGHRTTRECVRDCIFFPKSHIVLHEKENEGENRRYVEFLEVLQTYVKELDEDFEEYSPSALKIRLDLSGFDIDESFKFLNRLRSECVNGLIGTIDLRKPVELKNNYVALLNYAIT